MAFLSIKCSPLDEHSKYCSKIKRKFLLFKYPLTCANTSLSCYHILWRNDHLINDGCNKMWMFDRLSIVRRAYRGINRPWLRAEGSVCTRSLLLCSEASTWSSPSSSVAYTTLCDYARRERETGKHTRIHACAIHAWRFDGPWPRRCVVACIVS